MEKKLLQQKKNTMPKMLTRDQCFKRAKLILNNAEEIAKLIGKLDLAEAQWGNWERLRDEAMVELAKANKKIDKFLIKSRPKEKS